MKTIFILNNIHSFIDVITNSSTELFVYGGDKKLQEVYNILKELWDMHKYNYIQGCNCLGKPNKTIIKPLKSLDFYHKNAYI